MIVLPQSTDVFARRESGGKGYNLYLLSGQGVRVPPWVALGRSIFDQFLSESEAENSIQDLLDAYASGRLEPDAVSDRIKQVLMAPDWPDGVGEQVQAGYRRIAGDSEGLISVRSSAADEDSATHSFAGQLSSFLYVRGLEETLRKVRECWASNFSARALAYRLENGLPMKGLSVAVILQKMIDPETSGVLFTCDPQDGSPATYVASAVYGVGEGLVSGALEADTYWIESRSGEVRKREIVPKEQAFRRGSDGGCLPENVPADLRDKPCLDDATLGMLYRQGKRLDEFYGRPQDIEWAFDGKNLYILQARPVTTAASNASGYPNLWDNSNIIESYGGPTLPLSFTFALHNYKAVYIQFCEILHVPPKVVKDMEPYLGNMLGCINGRVYYNLYNWYKLVGVLPGFSRNRQFMETMMGVSEELSSEIAERIRPHPSWETMRGKLRRFVTGVSFVVYHFRIQPIVDRFLSDFQKEYNDFRHRDYRRMSSDGILNAYIEMDRRMLNHWKAPIINDFLCMVHFGLLKKLTEKWLSGLDENIQNDLLAGGGEIESAEPTRVLIQLAGRVANDKKLRELIEHTDAADLMEALNQSEHRDFYRLICEYIERFGFRCMSEMKLEETDLFTDPRFLFVCLKNYLRSGTVDLAAYERRKTELRINAEKRVRSKLQGIKRLVYLRCLHLARKAIRNRENTRFARTRVYGVARSMFQAMGDDLASKGIIEAPRDIFYLTLEEVFGIHHGTLTAYSLKDFIALRKQEYERFESEEPKKRFMTRGPVYWENNFLRESAKPDVPVDADYDLKGTPCCPGVVEGVVKVVHSPSDNLELNGEILVTPRTDPGWVPLYPSVSGLLVERGSLLSHSAIVAREMGLPAIVSIPGLVDTLQSGQLIRINAGEGTITIIDGEAEGVTENHREN